jgi:hypothetical protein
LTFQITRNQATVGTLAIVRAKHWRMSDYAGKRSASPVADQLLITLTDARGERVGYFELPMDQLPADE